MTIKAFEERRVGWEAHWNRYGWPGTRRATPRERLRMIDDDHVSGRQERCSASLSLTSRPELKHTSIEVKRRRFKPGLYDFGCIKVRIR